MGMTELFVPIALFVMIAVVMSLFMRLLATAMLHKTIREAMRSDASHVPLLAERLDRHAPWGDALLGWVFLAFAVALALLGITEPEDEERTRLLRATIIPVVVGVAVLVYARLSSRGTPRG